jgi:hypothetical protein
MIPRRPRARNEERKPIQDVKTGKRKLPAQKSKRKNGQTFAAKLYSSSTLFCTWSLNDTKCNSQTQPPLPNNDASQTRNPTQDSIDFHMLAQQQNPQQLTETGIFNTG